MVLDRTDRIVSSKDINLPDLLRDPLVAAPYHKNIYVVCRLGNDSQVAAETLRKELTENFEVKDLIGGLRAWSQEIDERFPVY